LESYERDFMNISDFKNVKVIDASDVLDINKQFEYHECISQANRDGLFVELGVYFGRSISYMAENNPDLHFYGFDTFEGLDLVWDIGSKKIDMKKFHVTDPDNIDTNTGLPKVPSNVTLTKGLFEDTLEPWLNKIEGNISFLNMDPDIYSAAIYALETLNDRIVPGTIIRFDELTDWRDVGYSNKRGLSVYTTWREGEWKALNEWLKKYNRVVQPLWRNWHQAAGVKVIK